jgi:hypothetical protein
VGVVADAPAPAQDADVELEDGPRVAAGEQDRAERDDRRRDEGDPEEDEHDEVRDREQPLDEPAPAAQLRGELSLEFQRIGGPGIHVGSSR